MFANNLQEEICGIPNIFFYYENNFKMGHPVDLCIWNTF